MNPRRVYRSSIPRLIRLGLGLLLTCTAAFSLSSCSTRATVRYAPPPTIDASPGDENNPGIDRHAMLVAIMALMSTPYVHYGLDSTGIDCSGFTGRIYERITHRRLPRSAHEQFEIGREVTGSEIKFGDLVFFHLDEPGPSHVGIYVGDGLFAHASVSRGVTVSLLGSAYYREHYVGARRVVY